MKAYIKTLDAAASADYDDACKALQIVCNATQHVNQMMDQHDKNKSLMQLQNRIQNCSEALMKPGRVLLKEGSCLKISRKAPDVRYLVLFSDDLMICKRYFSNVPGSNPENLEPEELLNLRQTLSLTEISVSEPDHKDEFPMDFCIKGVKKSFILRANSLKVKSAWVTALNQAIEDINKRHQTFAGLNGLKMEAEICDKLGYKAPIWDPDDRASKCKSCNYEFTMLFRKHHCRACGKVFCGNCSNQKAPLRYKNFQPCRVCDNCYDAVFKGIFFY